MQSWLTPTLFALFLYGLWGWFPKLASKTLDPKSGWFWEAIGYAMATIIVILYLGVKPKFEPTGALFAALTGVAGTLGTLFFFIAITKYKASVVTTITALYPIVAILLSLLILKEGISLKQGVGIVLALGSIYLISS